MCVYQITYSITIICHAEAEMCVYQITHTITINCLAEADMCVYQITLQHYNNLPCSNKNVCVSNHLQNSAMLKQKCVCIISPYNITITCHAESEMCVYQITLQHYDNLPC